MTTLSIVSTAAVCRKCGDDGSSRAVKVDFDVAGVNNSIMAVSLETEETKAEWDDDWGSVSRAQWRDLTNRRMHSNVSIVESSSESLCSTTLQSMPST